MQIKGLWWILNIFSFSPLNQGWNLLVSFEFREMVGVICNLYLYYDFISISKDPFVATFSSFFVKWCLEFNEIPTDEMLINVVKSVWNIYSSRPSKKDFINIQSDLNFNCEHVILLLSANSIFLLLGWALI